MNNSTQKRIIVDFKKLTPEILALVVDKYPEGYDDADVIKFRNAKNELVEAVEINTEEVKYLVKIGARLEKGMEDYDEDDYEDYDMPDTPRFEPPTSEPVAEGDAVEDPTENQV